MNDYGIGIIAAVLGAGLFGGVLALIIYILTALGLYRIAVNQGYKDKAILAWIPIANLYLTGLMIGQMKIPAINQIIPKMEIVLPIVVYLGSWVLGGVPVIGGLVPLAVLIFKILANYNIIAKYEQGGALPVIFAIFPFIGYATIGSNILKGVYPSNETD
jgi:hypothetical protein